MISMSVGIYNICRHSNAEDIQIFVGLDNLDITRGRSLDFLCNSVTILTIPCILSNTLHSGFSNTVKSS